MKKMAADEPTVIENWERQRVLGSGGFGVVTLWRNKITSQYIAVKKCRYDLYPLMNPKQQERWEKEVEIMLRLEHPNVVKAMKVPDKIFEDTLRKGAASLPLLCMEFCSRGDLRQVLNKSENCCGLREYEVRSLIRDVASAVKYLHSLKITHRDLKPENIVLQEEKDKIIYKLIDLGYAKELDQSSNCASFVGTLQYLAPELFTKQKMNLVQDKTSKDICAYQDYDGNVVFSSELFPENHISHCLKYYMEQWLKICLEWDSKIRGRSFINEEESRVIVFDMLDEILSKKTVNVFCLPTYDVRSYEVEESTRLRTLQGWIERDTNIPVERQEEDDDERKWDQCSLFVFLRDSFDIPKVTPQWPVLVEKMMQDTRRSIDYPTQKRTWAHAVFFLQQEANLYRHFLYAYKVKILHLFGLGSKLAKLWQKLYSEYQHILSQFELFMRSDVLASKMSILVQAVTLQEKNCATIASKIAHFKTNPAPRDTPYQALEPLALQRPSVKNCYLYNQCQVHVIIVQVVPCLILGGDLRCYPSETTLTISNL
ncbi:hypothetical protein J437_LFUL010280 [Ladona fulva]|uniref:IkappaB kinase n=1 Tax=Ladona fulva TaxID=123851 RepID=A0A8K0K8L6_LADFU|nr:hypothetical protein J437_LFUL010280 [Ladona fulva]